jgi:hypothetical protein
MLDRVGLDNQPPAVLTGLDRPQLFAGLFLLGCTNGLAIRIGRTVSEQGWLDAAFGTFDISVIVLAACFAGILLLYRDRTAQIGKTDIAVAALFVALALPPITSLSWFAIAALSFYILIFTDAGNSGRRGAIILLATTVPMLWAPLLFNFFSKAILDFDAALVAMVLGSDRVGNFVEFADHSGDLMVFPACSSLPNMALAFLCWITVNELVGHKWRPIDLLWCLLVTAAVLAVNVARMSLMGLNHDYYRALHSPVGETAINAVIFGVTLGICALGSKREILSRA